MSLQPCLHNITGAVSSPPVHKPANKSVLATFKFYQTKHSIAGVKEAIAGDKHLSQFSLQPLERHRFVQFSQTFKTMCKYKDALLVHP